MDKDNDIKEDPFAEYIREKEPDKREKGYAWYTGIGLQAVDGLKTSEYLRKTAVRNIEGEISMDEAQALLDSYYKANPAKETSERTEEADRVSLRIAKILAEPSFSFTPNEYMSIHRKLFLGIYSHAGKIRDYNITKKEWVLDGKSVIYGSASELRATLEYDFDQERRFSYQGLSMDEIIRHLARFISRLWQIHIFGEGNTRTTAVFFIKYLRTLGFDVTNDIFAENAWYFRNAMVRANYNDLTSGIHETTEYLELFLRNLLLGEKKELHNRSMHISGLLKNDEKADIQRQKADIQRQKTDIGDLIKQYLPDVSVPTKVHINSLHRKFPAGMVFGRMDAEAATGLKSTRVSELLKLLADCGMTEPVKGYGKGKYRFRV